jgi:hypothetical protein
VSFWEGSAWQERQEQRQKFIERVRHRVRTSNPSLNSSDVEEWTKREVERMDREHAASIRRCCVCRSAERAEVVRVGAYLGSCECKCHPRAGGPE